MSSSSGPTGSAAEIPQRVAQTLDFFKRHKLWHVVSRNSPATSCRDAAARRIRLGKQGIPLYDELKSLAVAVYTAHGGRHYALLHCRAHDRFDLEKARQILGADRPLARLASEELQAAFSTCYGTVNPFSERQHFIQVFDKAVLSTYTPPHSMMTNAGDLTWAVEFRPDEVIKALRSESLVQVAGIAINNNHLPKLPSFGIITGNGPESGMALWRHLNTTVHNRLSAVNRMQGDLSYPRVVIHSLPEMGLSMELEQRGAEVWAVIHNAVEQLCSVGVTHIALACNTTQYFANQIRKLALPKGVEFVSMAEITIDFIQRDKVADLTIIGIPVVASLGQFSAYRPLLSLNVVPVKEVVQPDLLELGYMVKKLGLAAQDNKALNKLQHILRTGVETDRVLIALTEISVLLERYPKLLNSIGGKTVIDPLRLYGEALAKIYIDSLPYYAVGDLSDDDGV